MRTAEVTRNTKETQIRVKVDLDGCGKAKLATGLPFLEHMLDQVARHGMLDLEIEARGDLHIDGHHTVEDIGITLGQAFLKAIGDKSGVRRFGHAYVPLDEALSRCVIDLSGRPFLHYQVTFKARNLGTMPTELFEDFFWALADHGRMNIHLEQIRGRNAHHIAETLFKATARALRMAVARDQGVLGIPSTKGKL